MCIKILSAASTVSNTGTPHSCTKCLLDLTLHLGLYSVMCDTEPNITPTEQIVTELRQVLEEG